jgi:diguanylate cyclase (GGDEF)-like protein
MSTQADKLTGLLGRQDFEQAITQACEQWEGVALVLVDVDHFKEINDTYGFEVGDTVLQAIAAALATVAPQATFRLGGDEFALLLESSLEQAFLRIEWVRAAIEQQALASLPAERRMTITAGVAHYPRDAKDLNGLKSAAGAALNSAKEGGRNQVCLPPTEEMVMKSCYYSAGALRKLKLLAERRRRKESQLLREALDDLLRKYDAPGAI